MKLTKQDRIHAIGKNDNGEVELLLAFGDLGYGAMFCDKSLYMTVSKKTYLKWKRLFAVIKEEGVDDIVYSNNEGYDLFGTDINRARRLLRAGFTSEKIIEEFGDLGEYRFSYEEFVVIGSYRIAIRLHHKHVEGFAEGYFDIDFKLMDELFGITSDESQETKENTVLGSPKVFDGANLRAVIDLETKEPFVGVYFANGDGFDQVAVFVDKDGKLSIENDKGTLSLVEDEKTESDDSRLTQLTITPSDLDVDLDGIEDAISEKISEMTGFCHYSFAWSIDVSADLDMTE